MASRATLICIESAMSVLRTTLQLSNEQRKMHRLHNKPLTVYLTKHHGDVRAMLKLTKH